MKSQNKTVAQVVVALVVIGLFISGTLWTVTQRVIPTQTFEAKLTEVSLKYDAYKQTQSAAAYAYKQTQGAAEVELRMTQSAAEVEYAPYRQLCQDLESSTAFKERDAKGPIWLMVLSDFTTFYSLMPSGTYGQAASISEATALVCVFKKDTSVETCEYSSSGLSGDIIRKVITRWFVETTVTLIDIRNKEKTGREVFYGYPPSCPPTLDISAPDHQILTGSATPISEISDWVRQHWSP